MTTGATSLTTLASWIGDRFGVTPKAPVAPDFCQALPDHDDEHDESDEEYLDESDLQGQSFVIDYCDSSGEVSTRRVTVRKLERTTDGCLCIKTFCWERKAARAFRADRILTLRHVTDLTPILNPAAFFEQYMHDGIDGEAAALLKRVRPGLRVLLYLARCDGTVHPSENDVMRQYVSAHSTGSSVSWSAIELFLEKQHPDHALARSMLKASLAVRAEAERLLAAAKRLVDADGVLTTEEIEGLDHMYRFSEALRYREDIQ